VIRSQPPRPSTSSSGGSRYHLRRDAPSTKPRRALSKYPIEGPERPAPRTQCHGAPPRTYGSALAHHLGSTTCATASGRAPAACTSPPIDYPCWLAALRAMRKNCEDMADGGSYDPRPHRHGIRRSMHTKSGTRQLLRTGSLTIFGVSLQCYPLWCKSVIVTVYDPDPVEWIDLKRRKQG